LPLHWKSFQINPNNLRILPEQFRYPRNNSGFLSYSFSNNSDDPNNILHVINTLSVLPYRFGTTPDMVETPLRPIIISCAWMWAKTPGYSEWLSLNRKCRVLSLCLFDTCFIRDMIVGIIIPSSISLPTMHFTHSHDISSPWPNHMMRIIYRWKLTEWAQSISPSRGWTNPAIDHSPQPIPPEYPRYTFMITQSRVTFDVLKASLGR